MKWLDWFGFGHHLWRRVGCNVDQAPLDSDRQLGGARCRWRAWVVGSGDLANLAFAIAYHPLWVGFGL